MSTAQVVLECGMLLYRAAIGGILAGTAVFFALHAVKRWLNNR